MDEGKIIRFIREEKKISQKALANGCCSERHLRNVEKGMKEPSFKLLSQLSERLEFSLHLLVNDDIRKYGFELYKRISEIESFFNEWKYLELENSIKDLSSEYMLESMLKKRIDYYFAICQKENHDDYRGAKEKLMAIIDLMSLNQIEGFLKLYRDGIDLDVVNALGVNESYYGNKEKALMIFEYLKAHIKKYDSIQTPFGMKVLYNISKILYALGRYHEAVVESEESVKLCQDTNDYLTLAGSYYYLGLSHKMMNNEDEARIFLKKYIYSRYLLNDQDKAMYAINNIVNENEFELDKDIID